SCRWVPRPGAARPDGPALALRRRPPLDHGRDRPHALADAARASQGVDALRITALSPRRTRRLSAVMGLTVWGSVCQWLTRGSCGPGRWRRLHDREDGATLTFTQLGERSIPGRCKNSL